MTLFPHAAVQPFVQKELRAAALWRSEEGGGGGGRDGCKKRHIKVCMKVKNSDFILLKKIEACHLNKAD